MARPSALLSWLLAALFVISAGLQYNDPDPWRWIALYLVAALASAALPLPSTRAWARPLALVVAVGAAAWAAVLVTGIWGKVGLSDVWLKMSEKGGAVEEEREAGGLLIVAIGLALGWWAHRPRAGA